MARKKLNLRILSIILMDFLAFPLIPHYMTIQYFTRGTYQGKGNAILTNNYNEKPSFRNFL